MIHRASPRYWACYRALPESVRDLADRAFEILKADPRHGSLHLKKAGRFWSVRVGISHRAVGVDCPDGILWFFIGTHADYDRIVGKG